MVGDVRSYAPEKPQAPLNRCATSLLAPQVDVGLLALVQPSRSPARSFDDYEEGDVLESHTVQEA